MTVFLVLLHLLLLLWHGPLTNLQLFRDEIEKKKKTGGLSKERKGKKEKRKSDDLCSSLAFRMDLYCAVLCFSQMKMRSPVTENTH